MPTKSSTDPLAGATVAFPFRGSRIGGSHVATFELMGALQREGTVSPVLVLNSSNEIAVEAERRGLPVRFTEEPADRRRNLPWTEAARMPWRMRWLRKLAPMVIVHNNDMGTQQSWGVAAALMRTPLLFHNHAFNRMMPPNTTLIRLAQRTLCVSEACRGAVDFLPADRAETVLNPITVSQTLERGDARRRLLQETGLPASSRLIGFVGNFWKRKRPEFAISAFAHLTRNVTAAALVFFGRDGDVTETELRAHAMSLGVEHCVRFVGFRSPADENIAALDLLMMPAVNEPFGRTLIEAALLGTPYVATDDAGHHEIGSRWGGGVLAPRGLAADDFAALCARTLERPDDVVLNNENRKRVAADFAPEEHGRQVLAAYRRALATGR